MTQSSGRPPNPYAEALNYAGKRILVVGGSSGIGNGIAQGFRAAGGEVHVWGTRPRDDYAIEDGSDLTGLGYAQVDATDFAAVEAHEPAYRELDVLVLCQGTVIYQRGEFTMEGFQRVVDVNLNSLMACALRFRQMLAVKRGVLILVSSTAAYHATRGNPAYSASKTGVVALTSTLAQAWASEGVRVVGLAPGLVDTKLTRVTTGNPRRLRSYLEKIPIGRIGTPDDMAGVALFLASPLAGFVVGQTLPVDGGMIL